MCTCPSVIERQRGIRYNTLQPPAVKQEACVLTKIPSRAGIRTLVASVEIPQLTTKPRVPDINKVPGNKVPGLNAGRETTLSHVHHRLFLKPCFLEAIYVIKYHQNLFTILH